MFSRSIGITQQYGRGQGGPNTAGSRPLKYWYFSNNDTVPYDGAASANNYAHHSFGNVHIDFIPGRPYLILYGTEFICKTAQGRYVCGVRARTDYTDFLNLADRPTSSANLNTLETMNSVPSFVVFDLGEAVTPPDTRPTHGMYIHLPQKRLEANGAGRAAVANDSESIAVVMYCASGGGIKAGGAGFSHQRDRLFILELGDDDNYSRAIYNVPRAIATSANFPSGNIFTYGNTGSMVWLPPSDQVNYLPSTKRFSGWSDRANISFKPINALGGGATAVANSEYILFSQTSLHCNTGILTAITPNVQIRMMGLPSGADQSVNHQILAQVPAYYRRTTNVTLSGTQSLLINVQINSVNSNGIAGGAGINISSVTPVVAAIRADRFLGYWKAFNTAPVSVATTVSANVIGISDTFPTGNYLCIVSGAIECNSTTTSALWIFKEGATNVIAASNIEFSTTATKPYPNNNQQFWAFGVIAFPTTAPRNFSLTLNLETTATATRANITNSEIHIMRLSQ